MLIFFFFFIHLNIFYKDVSPLSVFVKVAFNEEFSKDEIPHFILKLSFKCYGQQYHLPDTTNAYGIYHFLNDDLLGCENLKLNISLNMNLLGSNSVEDNSIVHITLENNGRTNFKFLKINEPYFDAIIDIFKHPVRYLEFVFNTGSKTIEKVEIFCENEDRLIAKIAIAPKDWQKQYRSKVIETKICNDNRYKIICPKNDGGTVGVSTRVEQYRDSDTKPVWYLGNQYRSRMVSVLNKIGIGIEKSLKGLRNR
uniref:Uncharacterized protein n=1 Tax=Meloidogyne hapla TaxID=6305 RepID=A0A1I8C035_MELHA